MAFLLAGFIRYVRNLRCFEFWGWFIIGDDWTIAALVASGIALTFSLLHARVAGVVAHAAGRHFRGSLSVWRSI